MSKSEQRPDGDWAGLCKSAKDLIPSEIGKDSWEIIVAAILTASPEPQLLAQFYSYLVEHDASFATEKEQERLSLRFRDTLMKLTTLVGTPQVLSALLPLAIAEGAPADKAKKSTLNPKWATVDVLSTHARGMQRIDAIYGELLPKVFQSYGSHSQDMQFQAIYGTYGLYLSDLEVMTSLEAEAITLAAICCTGLKRPSLWHMRGMGRLLGARGTDDDTTEMRKIKDILRALKTGFMVVVEFVGEDYARRANLENWVNVGDVVRELDGWGGDELK